MAEAAHRDRLACFFEQNPALPLARRTFVEAIGTMLLIIAMVGSGLNVARFAANEPLVASMIVALSIAGALVGLIVALGKVSGGHYNPIITISQWLSGERSRRCMFAYVFGQIVGAVIGALVCAQMFANVPHLAPTASPTVSMLLSEVVASTGLMTIVFGCARSTKWETGPFAVGAWLTAGILATPSASYANPAVTIAAAFAAGPVALAPLTAAGYVVAQIVGMLVAMVINRVAFDRAKSEKVSS